MPFIRENGRFLISLPEAMIDFGNHAIVEGESGYKLAFPREWEAHNYRTIPYVWSAVKSLTMPVMGIRGENSDVLMNMAMKKWQALQPSHQLIEVEGVGHMVPQEAPLQCARLVNKFLKSI